LPATEPILVIVSVKDTRIEPGEYGDYRVTLSAGTVAKAEAETQDGKAQFMLSGVDFPRQNFSIRVTTSSLPVSGQVRRGFEDLDGSITGNPPSVPPPVPLSVEIFMIPLNVKWRHYKLPPGFLCLEPTTYFEPTSIRQRWHLELVPVGKTFAARFSDLEGGDEYCTMPFSPGNLDKDSTNLLGKDFAPWSRTKRLPDLPANATELLASASIDPMHIQPADWRKGIAGEWPNPSLCEECRLLVPLDQQKPELIILRRFPEPKPPENPRSANFDYWISLFQ
jgi:hypothetical protein